MATQYSYTRVDTWHKCPYRYALHYLAKVQVLSSYNAQNQKIIGRLMHKALESSVPEAVAEYFAEYPIISDDHIHEVMKIEELVPKVTKLLPKGFHEVKIETPDFVGYIDLLVPLGGGWFDLYDYKYSNNPDTYLTSEQLHLYKYFYELTHPGHHIRKMFYVLVPKTMIRQRKDESLTHFRERIRETIEPLEPKIVEVQYDAGKITTWLIDIYHLEHDTEEYPRTPGKFCGFCQYKNFCEKGETYDMLLPKNERVPVGSVQYMKGWIYGAPFSGKTTFLDSAPDPLNLNTDGNTKYVTMQRIYIRDEVTMVGRMAQRKLAWEVFKEVIDELEKKQNDFKTILVDLLEDTREMCRVYMYNKMGIQHESDAGYGKGWDVIKTEYLTTMRRLLSLDYNIFLVSHEDVSKDITKKSGDKITRIAPNIQEAIANKIAGMVDFVGRVVVHEDGSRTLAIKPNETTFGGGRLKALTGKEIPLKWDELVKAYEEAKQQASA